MQNWRIYNKLLFILTLFGPFPLMCKSVHFSPSFLAERSRYWYSVASVCRRRRVVCTGCIVAKRCVLEQKLLLTAYRKSYIWNRLVPKWMTLTFV